MVLIRLFDYFLVIDNMQRSEQKHNKKDMVTGQYHYDYLRPILDQYGIFVPKAEVYSDDKGLFKCCWVLFAYYRFEKRNKIAKVGQWSDKVKLLCQDLYGKSHGQVDIDISAYMSQNFSELNLTDRVIQGILFWVQNDCSYNIYYQ